MLGSRVRSGDGAEGEVSGGDSVFVVGCAFSHPILGGGVARPPFEVMFLRRQDVFIVWLLVIAGAWDLRAGSYVRQLPFCLDYRFND